MLVVTKQRLVRGGLNLDYLKGSGISFWIDALVRCKTGEALPSKGRQIKNIPKHLDLTNEERYAASQALDQGMLWYLKVDGKGWIWTQSKGTQDVASVHRVLQWLYRFQESYQVDGCELIHAEVVNQIS